MIRWSQLPLGDLTIATLISLETAGFIGNKYGPFYSFAYMFYVNFVIIFLISLDASKRNSKLEKIEPKKKVKVLETKTVEKEKVVAEKLNGRFAMIGFIAAIGAYLTTGQIIPGFV
jgi:hypothetical protein